MSRKQKVAIVVGALVIAGLALFPGVDPDAFRAQLKAYNRETSSDVRWALLDYGQRVYVPPPPSE